MYELGKSDNGESSTACCASSASSASSASFQVNGKSRPMKRTQIAKKKIKYSDESYEELEGLSPEELRQLNRIQEEAGRATDRYEELLDVQRSMDEEIAHCLNAVHQMDNTVDTFKEYLDFKYRK